MDQPRSTQRYQARRKVDEEPLVRQMHELVRRHPRFGYRRIHALLERSGFTVNRKRVWRLWKREGFKVPQKQVKKRRLGTSANGITRLKACHANHVWAWDFIHDRDEHGRPLKWLSIVDEFTRECLALEVGRSIKATDALDVLRTLLVTRGVPRHMRSDNGPEFISAAMQAFLAKASVETLYIEPGSPWQNGYVESFHGRLRDELLDAEIFADVVEARALASHWRRNYNHVRPHSSLGYVAPAQFAATLKQVPLRATPSATPASAKQTKTLIGTGT